MRLFNTYGPRMQPDDGRVVSNFIMQALAGQPLTVYGTGEQTRSFCYVDDTVEALIRMMATDARRDRPDQHRQPARDHRAASSPSGSSDWSTRRSAVQYLPLPADDPQQRQPDITRARADPRLGAHRSPWQKGWPRTVAWFRETYGAEVGDPGSSGAGRVGRSRR